MFNRILELTLDCVLEAVSKVRDVVEDAGTARPKPEPLKESEKKKIRETHRTLFTKNGHPMG